MKSLLILMLFCLTAPFLSYSAFAQDIEEQSQKVRDALKDITIHERPSDFQTAKLLAIENRQERIQMLENIIACIDKSSSIDDIYSCQATERKTLNRIWLSYCDTSISFLTRQQRMDRSKNTAAETRNKDCESALEAYLSDHQ